jgi:hypothetical protein
MAIVYDADGLAGKICNKCGEWKPLTEYSGRMELRSKNRDYYRQHRGWFYEYVNRRRARKAQAEGSHTQAE